MVEISKFVEEADLQTELSVGRDERKSTIDTEKIVEQVIHRAQAGAGVNFDLLEVYLRTKRSR